MGFIDFREEAKALVVRPATGRIGTIERVSAHTATSIVPPAKPGGAYVFGPEIAIQRREATRDMVRIKDGTARALPFMRYEFSIDLKDARDAGLDSKGSLFVGETPVGQRRVHRLRLQTYSTKLDTVVFEALADLEAPLDTIAARESAGDAEAIAALGQKLRCNPFVSNRLLTASLSSGDVAAFTSFEDDHKDGAKQRFDSGFAVGVVANAEAARAALFADRRVMRAFDETGNGRLRARFNRNVGTLPLVPEVSDKAPRHLDLAIAQALCGAGSRTAAWEGKPVADFVLFLFEQHMLAALRRRDGELIETRPFPEGYDPPDGTGIEYRPGLYDEDGGDEAGDVDPA